ncbi:MAG: hypothetical protein WBD40_23570, partial [Tepidisphaeraceae bacterium]
SYEAGGLKVLARTSLDDDDDDDGDPECEADRVMGGEGRENITRQRMQRVSLWRGDVSIRVCPPYFGQFHVAV